MTGGDDEDWVGHPDEPVAAVQARLAASAVLATW